MKAEKSNDQSSCPRHSCSSTSQPRATAAPNGAVGRALLGQATGKIMFGDWKWFMLGWCWYVLTLDHTVLGGIYKIWPGSKSVLKLVGSDGFLSTTRSKFDKCVDLTSVPKEFPSFYQSSHSVRLGWPSPLWILNSVAKHLRCLHEIPTGCFIKLKNCRSLVRRWWDS